MPDLNNWIILLGSAGFGGALTAFFQWLASRGKNSQDFQVKRAEIENHRYDAIINHWKAMFETADARADAAERRCEELHALLHAERERSEAVKAEAKAVAATARANEHLADALEKVDEGQGL